MYNIFPKGGAFLHNKEYALKLVQDKLNGLNNYSYSQIAFLTGYTKTQIYRFAKLLNEKDIDSLLTHGLSGKQSNNSTPPKEIEFIKAFKNQYPLISIQQFMDIYHEDVIWNPDKQDLVIKFGLKLRSYSFFESLFKRSNWVSPIKHKSFYEDCSIHPLRDPSPNRGILVMIDGTPHDWFQNGVKWSLHLAIDDATGEILCGWFMPNECLYGYTMLLNLLVTMHGIPENIYSDRISVLIALREGNITNFDHMCEDLGINQFAALSPEAKGKVERMNFTLQNRLLIDIKRFNIKTYDELNSWFNSFYKDYINRKFAYAESKFSPLSNQNLEYIFCTRTERVILDGQVISFNGKYYKVINDIDEVHPIYRKSNIIVHQNVFNHKIYVYHKGVFFNTELVHDRIGRSEKIRITKIENQKKLEQALRERDERLKSKFK